MLDGAQMKDRDASWESEIMKVVFPKMMKVDLCPFH